MSLRFGQAALLAAFCTLLFGIPAQAQQWQVVVQPGGYRVARVVAQGTATGIGFTCERNLPVIAVNLARPPARNPASIVIAIDGQPFAMALVRNQNTNVWVAGVRDRRLIDAMAAGRTAQITVQGVAYGSVPLAGASSALAAALAPCHRLQAPPVATAPKQPAARQGPLSRLPIQLGYYVGTYETCRRPSSVSARSISFARRTSTTPSA